MRLNPTYLQCLTWTKWRMIIVAALLPVTLSISGCAVTPPFDGRVEILSSSRDQSLTGADCVVTTDSGSWTVQTPGHAAVGAANGDLRVVCDKAGYRTSEVIHRSSAAHRGPGASRVGVGIGGGRGVYSGVGVSLGFGFPLAGARSDYPSRVTVDMTPLQ